MAWRLARSLEVLRDELNAHWPNRDRSSDGGIGDPAHAGEGSASDHNPWVLDRSGVGVVRAYDIDVDLDENDPDAARRLAEHLRELGEAGDDRLTDHGYVIYAGQIASFVGGWVWRAYTGIDPHTSHIHLSVTRSGATPSLPYPTIDPALFDGTEPWGIEGDDMPTADEIRAIVRDELAYAYSPNNDSGVYRRLVADVVGSITGVGSPSIADAIAAVDKSSVQVTETNLNVEKIVRHLHAEGD